MSSWRVQRASAPVAAAPSIRTLARTSSVAVLALVAMLGCFALFQHHQMANSLIQPSELSVPIVNVPTQARKQMMESQVVRVDQWKEASRTQDKVSDALQSMLSMKQSADLALVSRKELHEVSDKIATAVRSSRNGMDVRVLQEIGSPKPCGPKRPPTTTPRGPSRPCIPRPSPTPPVGNPPCSLCATYTYPVTNEVQPNACDAPIPANVLTVLNTALLNAFPALFNQIGNLPTNCSTFKDGQQNFATHGPYCVFPVDPADYPAIEDTFTASAAAIAQAFVKFAAIEPAARCASPTPSSTVVVGQSVQYLTITLVCDDPAEPTPSVTKSTYANTCDASASA